MRRHRTTAKTCAGPESAHAGARRRTSAGIVVVLLLAVFAALLFSPRPASGRGEGVPRLVFPLVAKTELWDNYGDPRPNGSHAGIDMENPWRAPVVAVESGRVQYWESGLGGCMLYLHGRSGTTYMYIHLNNDLTPRNDNRGRCHEVAYAVPDGATVAAGEQIAWNGDSGDANGNPHLHFEVHPGGGADTNPYPYLKRATRPLFAAKPGSKFSLGLRGRLLSGGEDTVELEVSKVRHYPGGRWLDIDTRRVELTVPLEASIAPPLAQLASLERQEPKTAVPVIAHTATAKATLGAVLGTRGTLILRRVAPTR